MDYEFLRITWWVLIGVLLFAFSFTGGFDLGAASAIFFVAKNNEERRSLINSIAPTWDGNQVWFILGGGAIFAAWPTVYSVSFSSLYLALLLVLLALIIRPVGFEFRQKIDSDKWRKVWDICLLLSGSIPAFAFGVACGCVMQGLDFRFNEMMMQEVHPMGLDRIFTPFSITCGVVSYGMLLLHGSNFLIMKADKTIAKRCLTLTKIASAITISAFVLGHFLAKDLPFFTITSLVDHLAASSPTIKTVGVSNGFLLHNFQTTPALYIVPLCAIAFLALSIFITNGAALFVLSSATIGCIISTMGISIFPFILPSALEPNHSLTIWDASSSVTTLKIMFFCTVIFLPIILTYTIIAYKKMFGRVTTSYVKQNSKQLY